ncbi:hypothetical protein V6N11_062888 [Hibiscus sabdariffa]|uniref:Uncharacterized protein n=1 Tax=Hibiscus sabdariffa TaxID=183260 RepID=A0ABR2NPV2_9ROSI
MNCCIGRTCRKYVTIHSSHFQRSESLPHDGFGGGIAAIFSNACRGRTVTRRSQSHSPLFVTKEATLEWGGFIACSKPGVEPWGSSEGSGLLSPRAEGTV